MMMIVNTVSKLSKFLFHFVLFCHTRKAYSSNTEKIKVLQPVSNQYNITEKIKEANQQLYKCEQSQRRSSHPKVRFRDHQLVDYEPEEGGDDDDDVDVVEIMERRKSITIENGKRKEEESSDDGYIDDEVLQDASTDERLIIETIEIEEVFEQIEVLDITDVKTTNDIIENEENNNNNNNNHNNNDDDLNYEKDDFHEEDASNMERVGRSKKSLTTKKFFRSKINPSDDDMASTAAKMDRRKHCCQYKETDEYKQKLPKYNGYYSHYGLSKDEIERRERKQLKNVEFKHRRFSQHTEQKEHVAKTNEEAFAKW